MPFEHMPAPRRRIAVIGGGISGMVAADSLAPDHDVTLIEAESRLGGHARTVLAGKRGDQPVDTGFIVFNRVNYPGLVRLFEDLDVPVVESDMSFGASIRGGWFEYGTDRARNFLAQPTNLLRPAFHGMFHDMRRFNARAIATAMSDPQLTIGGLLDRLGTGDWFRDYYITPLSGAIWSTPCAGILDFPAMALLRFFENHNLLGMSGQHQWWTVRGGSVEYVRRLQARLVRRGVDLRLGVPLHAIRREAGAVELRVQGGEWERFDEVVLATHADVSLALLSDASAEEHAALSRVRFQPNRAVLHADASVMPKRRRVWSSWNYAEPAGAEPGRIDLTYWMNRLQPIPQDDPLFVTLNPNRAIRDDLIHEEVTFHHPLYTAATFEGQSRLRALNGARGTWFCGAWMKNGFHEDGLGSAVEVVQAMAARHAQGVAA